MRLLFALIPFLVPLLCPARDINGTTQMGEGGELIVTEGVVVREVPADAPDKYPLIAVGTAKGVHHLYDPNQFAMQGFWTGQFGRVDDNGHFVPNTARLKTFHLDQAPPWTFGEKPRHKVDYAWHGNEVQDDQVHFRYALAVPELNLTWEITETLEHLSDQSQKIHFSIKPNAKSDLYLNYWVRQTEFRRLSTNGQQSQRNRLKNLHPNQEQFTISFLRRKESPTLPHGYSIEAIDIPAPDPPFLFEPTDIAFAPDSTAFASTRTGGVWRRNPDTGSWNLFADGLHESNGIQIAPDGKSVYVMQKPELTLLKDTNDDGTADLYETVEDRFRFTGHYHEFAYGPRLNSKGELFFSTGLASSGYHTPTGTTQNQMTSALGYRGWVMRHNADGSLTPFAPGLRSPAGIGMNADDELFITDNQGDWVASSYLGHVEENDFLGHPAALWDRAPFNLTPPTLDYSNISAIPETVPLINRETFQNDRKRPAVWLAHGDLTNSPGHPAFAPDKGFGPFGGQAFIADIAHRNIVRVALEKIDGQYQGAVFPFIRPLTSAAYSAAFDPQGNLWIGSVGRGWVAGDPAIEIICHKPNTTPFEIHHVALTRDGFDVHFTKPIARTNLPPSEISVTEFQYEYWEKYGSEPSRESQVPVTKSTISPDQHTLSLQLPLKADFVYQIQLPELKAASGLTLDNNFAVYTLNRLLP
ncbi:MAG: hypothetical protein AAGD22_10170 [Verrucomicrobiota bacterium]